MKSRIFFLITLLLLVLLSVSCSKKEVKGEVFIVTQGAGNYKLGLVNILAIPEDSIKTYASNKSSTEFFLDPDKYFTQLPHGVATATTDADGKFTLKLPKAGRYVFAARAERKVVDKTEKYYWLVWASVYGNESKTVTLSNNNLADSDSPDSLIQVVRY